LVVMVAAPWGVRWVPRCRRRGGSEDLRVAGDGVPDVLARLALGIQHIAKRDHAIGPILQAQSIEAAVRRPRPAGPGYLNVESARRFLRERSSARTSPAPTPRVPPVQPG